MATHTATTGLARTVHKLDAEQVYVRQTGDEDRPIMLDAWSGYSTVGKFRLTRRQAQELVGLLAAEL